MPASNEQVTAKIRGLREAKAAFQRFPVLTREHLNDATELTLAEVVRHAKNRLASSPAIRTRALYNAVAYTLNRNSGRGKAGVADVTTMMRVGGRRVRVKGIIVAGRGGSALTSQGARKIRPVRYDHIIEFGSVHAPAEPFMRPAEAAQRQPYLNRIKAAMAKGAQQVAVGRFAGSGTL